MERRAYESVQFRLVLASANWKKMNRTVELICNAPRRKRQIKNGYMHPSDS